MRRLLVGPSPHPAGHARRLILRGLLAGIAAGTLASPGAAQVLVGDGTVTCGSAYVVQSGDTLSRLAERAYGDPLLYGFIADANWDLIGGDPERVAVGMSLAIPCVDAAGEVLTPEQAAEAASSMEAVVAAEGVLTPQQLDTLFGPVALFPDQVLTLVLVAATFPLDVVKAARFVEESADLPDQERAGQADQTWDDSVRQLAAAFPELLERMNTNIDWTEQAGEAVVAQTDEVLAAIQRLRGKAQENGYLVDNEAQTVEATNGTIVIQPANPNVVYVPTYQSEVVYTTPITGPAPIYQYGYYEDDDGWEDALVAGGIMLGGAIILDEIFDDDDWGGWDNDDIDWDGGDITIDRGDIDIDRGIDIEGDVNIDRGDRVAIGGDDRMSIRDSDRVQVDRDELAGRVGDGARAGTLPANRTSISNTASRDVARQKIQARQATSPRPATLQASRPQVARGGGSQQNPFADLPARSVDRGASLSGPSTNRAPTMQVQSRSNAFQRSSGGSRRAAAASNRGRASMGGGRSGGRGGGRR
jgi:hypothetical protein